MPLTILADSNNKKWGNDETKKDFIGYVDRNFMDIKCNTTYYLTADETGGGFGYCEEKDLEANKPYATWTMALTEPDAAAQVRKTVHIQNVGSKNYVEVTGKFEAEPDYTPKDNECATVAEDDAAHNATHITLRMARFRHDMPNNYEISELSSATTNQDVREYMDKIRRKVVNKLYASEDLKKYAEAGAKSFYKLYDGRTQADETNLLLNDVKMAADIVCRNYLKLKVRQVNGKQVLYFDFPDVPEIVCALLYNNNNKTLAENKAAFWNDVKQALENVVEEVDAKDIDKVKRNLDKVSPNHTYYLTADDVNTFSFEEIAYPTSTRDSLGYVTSYAGGINSVETFADNALWNLVALSSKIQTPDNTVDLGWGEAPIAGKYTIKNKQTGKYVEVKSKYYARPDVDEAEASKIYVGVGVKNDNDTVSYRLYSLGTDKAKDGTTGIECYDYLDKAIGWCYDIAQRMVDKLTVDGEVDVMVGKVPADEMKALADSVINYYRDDYAYLSIQPVSGQKEITKAGESADVYAKVSIPALPEVANQIYRYSYYDGTPEMNPTLWEEAKKLVLEKLNEKYGADPKKTDVMGYINRNLMNIMPNTTYFLTADADPVGGFDYCKASEVKAKGNLAVWTMTMTEPDDDAQLRGTFHIQNVQTKRFVEVTGKYEAEPNYEMEDVDIANVDNMNAAHQNKQIAIKVNMARFDRNNTDCYQISELANDKQYVNRYLWKIHDLAVEAMDKIARDLKDPYINGIAEYFLGSNATDEEKNALAEQFINDSKMAVDMVAREYLKLKIRKQADGSLTMYHEFPTVPVTLDNFVKQHYKKGLWEVLKDYIKETLEDPNNHYIHDYPNAVDKIVRNIQNLEPGNTYVLAAQEDDNTFDYAVSENGLANVEPRFRWNLIDLAKETNPDVVEATDVEPIDGYFHLTSAVDNKIVNVTDYSWATPSLSLTDASTKAGSVIYVKAQPVRRNGVLQYQLKSLRAQGVEFVPQEKMTFNKFYYCCPLK